MPVSFLSPLLLVGLLSVPAAVAFAVVVDRRRSRYPVAFTNLELLASISPARPRRTRWAPASLLVLALAFAATALARPVALLRVVEENATIVFLVDVSGSMAASDVEPTRLSAAVNAMHSFLLRLPPRSKVGLVAFSAEPEVLVRPTRDRALLAEALSYLAPESGTALGDGLAAAVRLAVSSLARDGVRRVPGQYLPAAIVLESDGAQNRGLL